MADIEPVVKLIDALANTTGTNTTEAVAWIQEASDILVNTTGGLDVFYLLFAGAMVFFMQAGFAMLCAGSIRAKNVKNIMLKNILDACGGAIGFWTIGYAFAFGNASGTTKNTFIGNSGFVLKDIHGGGDLIFWFFQFAFAATAATIVAGTVAERCKFEAYIAYSLMLTGFVYPVVVHSIWSSNGFLSAFSANPWLGSGMIDFAGSGVVHMTGGITALCAAKILGPRIGRFYDADGNELPEPVTFQPHSVALQVLGTFILWVGWYGFNPGSTLGISPSGYADVCALCAVTTTLAAASGSVSAMFTDMLLNRRKTGETMYDITMCMNGALSGVVGITAGCSVVEPWAAWLIGIIAGWVYIFWSSLLVKLKIDDAVDAIPVHFGNGMWGCIAVGLFASPGLVGNAYGSTNYGWFYNWGMGSGDGTLLAIEICGILFIIGWVCAIMIPYFLLLNMFGLFRVDAIEEEVGLDISHHKGAAYDMSGPSEDAKEKYEISTSQRKLVVPKDDDEPAAEAEQQA
jgi:Amt family ammonium transporter